VGTKTPNKIRAVEDAYRLFGIPARIVPAPRPLTTPPQPVGLEAVLKGAVERAKAALQAVEKAEHGVGIEAGVVEAGGVHLVITIAAIVDAGGRTTIGFGPPSKSRLRFSRKYLAAWRWAPWLSSISKDPL